MTDGVFSSSLATHNVRFVVNDNLHSIMTQEEFAQKQRIARQQVGDALLTLCSAQAGSLAYTQAQAYLKHVLPLTVSKIDVAQNTGGTD